MTKISITGNSKPISAVAGFTLIELLVVLTITSILVASISFLVPGKQQTLKQVSEEVTRNLRLVRQQAIRDDRQYQVEINLADNSILFRDSQIELSADVSVTVRTSENQLVDKETAGISFYPDASSSGGVITLENSKELYEISIIWISGKIQSRYQALSS